MRGLGSYGNRRSGIALFILMTSIALMSLVMRELITSSSTQASRVKNSADRIQALYLARSSLNLARFVLYIDRVIDSQKHGPKKDELSDCLDDLWATPNNFPLTAEEVEALIKSQADKTTETKSNVKVDKDFTKTCQQFFDDFPGTAASITSDLSSRLYLNDLGTSQPKPTFDTLVRLLQPNADFIQHLSDLNTDPERLAREIRDTIDQNQIDDDTQMAEDGPYQSLRLDYGPKNRVLTTMDELKLIPHLDDTVFDYLSNWVNPYYMPTKSTPPSKINLNTVSKEVFQALLIKVSDPERIAENFIKDRKTNKRVYTEKQAKQMLHDALQLDETNINLNQLTGVSDSFKIETTATVNHITLKLETILARPVGQTKPESIVQMRVSP